MSVLVLIALAVVVLGCLPGLLQDVDGDLLRGDVIVGRPEVSGPKGAVGLYV